MIDKNILKNFIREFEELIQNEKKDNKPISATIQKIDGKTLTVSLKRIENIQSNSTVEINKIQAKIIKNNKKNLIINLDKKGNFYINQAIKINNLQKQIIIQKLENLLESIKDNQLNKENIETLESVLSDSPGDYDDKRVKIESLNNNQLASLNYAISANKFHIIKGPPGTGKTHTIVEIINYLYEHGYRILITTHTHIALDNILEKLDFIPDEKILRVGLKDKITENVHKYTIDEQIKKHELYSHIKNLKRKNRFLRTKLDQNNYDCVDKTYDNIQSDDENTSIIKRLISKFYNPPKIDNGINYIEENINDDKIKEAIFNNNEAIYEIQNQLISNLYEEASIIATTILSSSSTHMKNIEFDYIIMDEASQVPLYLSLIALMKTDKFILIGDDKQLQPITNNYYGILTKSIFNHMIEKYPNNHSFLNIQYRMNHEIADIASKLYYHNKLLTYPKIANQKIKLPNNKNILLDDNPITLIDTSNTSYYESNTSSGCYNKNEINIIKSIIKSLLLNNIKSQEIGVITPYRKQKIYLQKKLQEENINVECDTIYRFQGREKDVIIISYCKSSKKTLTDFQKRFLSNPNQLNVSITRSRKKLIIIADVNQLKVAAHTKKLFHEISPLNRIYLEDLI